jgi:hypothetical protein
MSPLKLILMMVIQRQLKLTKVVSMPVMATMAMERRLETSDPAARLIHTHAAIGQLNYAALLQRRNAQEI